MNENQDDKRKSYLLRWNPAISSFTMDAYMDAINQYPGGFTIDWSVYEWEEAHAGDWFCMVRVGEGETGIVFVGDFISEPYEDKDWAGQPGKKRHYVDLDCWYPVNPEDGPLVSMKELQEAIPEIDWNHGHSGVLLTDEQAEKVHSLVAKNNLGEY